MSDNMIPELTLDPAAAAAPVPELGLISPPCGLPPVVGKSLLLSIYPHFRNCFIILLSVGMFSIIHSRLILSKQPLISPSRIHSGEVRLDKSLNMYSMASCSHLSCRNPKEALSAVVSAIGARASSCSPCIALSDIVGMPSGRLSFLPYFSI